MLKIAYIASGGAIGAVLRYIIALITHERVQSSFPWGTLIINLTGAFLIGFLGGLCEHYAVSHNIRIFLFIGILGAYTTFSTFCLENFNLFKSGQLAYALINIVVSNILGLFLVYVGFISSRWIYDLLHQ